MKFKRILAVLLAIAMLPTFFAGAISKEEEARIITDEDYAAVDEMWESLTQVETKELKSRRGAASADEEATASTAQAVAQAAQESAIYVDGSLEWSGEDCFTFETTTGVTCGYSARLRNKAMQAQENASALAEPDVQTVSYGTKNTTSAKDVFLIEPYYGLDSSFTKQYQNEGKDIAAATGGTYTLYTTNAATIDKIADAMEQGAVVIFDSHGDTDYANGEDYTSGATTSYLCLQTGTGLTEEDYARDGRTYHAVNYGSAGSMKLYCIDGTVIANHMEKNAPNSLLWIAICLGMATDGLQAPMREKGVGVVYGYSQSVTFDYDYLWEAKFFDEMFKGASVAEAVAAMKESVGYWDYASYYASISTAIRNDCSFPIVVSDEDVYPGHGNVDGLQTVYSTWTLIGGEDEEPTEPTEEPSEPTEPTEEPSEPTEPTEPSVTYTCVARPNDESLGSVQPDGADFVAIPNENASLSGWTLTPEDAATVTQNGNRFTVSNLTADCELVITFTRKTDALVQFVTPAGVSKASVSGYVGDPIALSAPTGAPTADLYNYRYLGWAKAAVADTTQKPDYYTNTITPDTAQTTLYALYTYTSADAVYYTTELKSRSCASAAFSDVNTSSWYHAAVDFVVERGLMNGVGGGKFAPDETVTRAMLATILYRLDGGAASGKHPFTDVPDGAYYSKAVAWAYENGIVTGTSATTFDPNGDVTREQTAAMLYRYAQYRGDDVASNLGNLASFKDFAEISAYAKTAMRWAVGSGVMKGDNAAMLDPRGHATRAQIAQMLLNWIGGWTMHN
ncbi:MAG: S-layer homology domain-containing protein [Oscillospiraceae bacterium]|jgi:hypothetical protein|nr:S-layer homology domain-containing protein [Oscillospiraceae bacterium]